MIPSQQSVTSQESGESHRTYPAKEVLEGDAPLAWKRRALRAGTGNIYPIVAVLRRVRVIGETRSVTARGEPLVNGSTEAKTGRGKTQERHLGQHDEIVLSTRKYGGDEVAATNSAICGDRILAYTL